MDGIDSIGSGDWHRTMTDYPCLGSKEMRMAYYI